MPDFDAPGEYLRANYERKDWLAVVLIYRNPSRVKQEFATAEKIAAPHYQAHLRAANASGADVYLTVNSLKPGATARKKADVEAVRHVFLDLDGGGREAVDRIVRSEGMPNPHHVLNTSPDKHQIIWSVERFERDQAEDLVRTMATKFDADQAVWDIARVLRMPGFRNHKYEELRHFVKDVHEDPPSVSAYGPEDFPKLLDGERGWPVALDQPNPQAANGIRSQSERDWAYVMRQLERGVDPGVLRSQLQQFRQDKPNPHYYAQRTIARAMLSRARSVARLVSGTVSSVN
jgi:RepB DNA-primase from phage plasmid